MKSDFPREVQKGRERAREQADYLSPYRWKPGASLRAWARDARYSLHKYGEPAPSTVGMIAYIAEWARIARERR